MRTMLRGAAPLALAGWLVVAGMAPSAGRAAVPSEKSLPATTFVYLKTDSVAKLRSAFNHSQFGQLLADPAMKPLKDDITAKLESVNNQVKEKIGFSIGELLDLPQGAVSVAVLGRDDPKIPVAGILSADAGSNAAKMDDLLARLTKEAEKDNDKVSTQTFKGMKLTIIKSGKEQDKDDPPLVWTKQGSVFHVSTDVEALKDLLSHPEGREESLAANDNFAAVKKKVGDNAQILWFLDVSQVFKLLTQVGGAQGGNAEQIVAQLQLTGLNGLKALGGSLAFSVGDFDQLTKMYVYSPGPAQGILKIFSMPKVNLKPQAWVPATVASYQSVSWDLDNAYNAINELADMFAPGVLGNLEKQLAADGEGISFQKDIFGPIGDRITVVSDFKKPITEKSQRVLFALALEDAKAFQNTLSKVLAKAKLSPKKREFQGTTIYDFDLSGIPNPGNANIPAAISLAIAKDNLFVSTEATLLEQILRSGGASLADSPEYQAVARQFPDATSTLTFERPEESIRLVYNMVKSGELGKALENAKTPNGPDLAKVGEAIDPNKVPEFSVIAKYLSPGGGYGVMDEDGVTLMRFTLKKSNP
jgi:hypothetical protein